MKYATLLDELEVLLMNTKPDYEKGRLGVKAAGRRTRKAMQDVKKLAQEIREEMLACMKSEGAKDE